MRSEENKLDDPKFREEVFGWYKHCLSLLKEILKGEVVSEDKKTDCVSYIGKTKCNSTWYVVKEKHLIDELYNDENDYYKILDVKLPEKTYSCGNFLELCQIFRLLKNRYFWLPEFDKDLIQE